MLGQVAVAAKSNELTAWPALRQVLALEGCIVTIGAMGCQTAIAQTIVEQGGDYVLALKANQPTLHDAVATYFAAAQATAVRDVPHGYTRTVDGGYGRVERRQYGTIADPDLLAYRYPTGAWAGLARLGMVERERRTVSETTCEVRGAFLPEQSRRAGRGLCPRSAQPLGHRGPPPLGAGHCLPGE